MPFPVPPTEGLQQATTSAALLFLQPLQIKLETGVLYPEGCTGNFTHQTRSILLSNIDPCRYVRAKARMIFKMLILCEMVLILLFSEGGFVVQCQLSALHCLCGLINFRILRFKLPSRSLFSFFFHLAHEYFSSSAFMLQRNE